MTTQTIPARIVIRRDNAANWTAQNPTLLSGEWGLETDTRKLKIGNGTSAWNALDYYSTGGGGSATDLSVGTRTATTMVIASSSGVDATLPAATTSQAGLMTAASLALLNSAIQPSDLGPYLSEAEAAELYQAIGSAQPSLVPVRNTSGGSLAIGTVVRITGSTGARPTVSAADASEEATAAQTLGLLTATLVNNSDGLAITHGILGGVNTSALTEGAAVWLSETTGGLTSTRPTQPAHGVFLGFCVKASPGSAGILYVNVINGQELEELHDVLITGAPPAAGARRPVLARQSSGLWSDVLLTAADVEAATAAQGALAATAVQPAALAGYVQTTDSRMGDAREWSASTVSEADATAGTATDRRAWTVQRVWQAIAAWWAASAAKTKLDGIASGATANATDAQLRDRSTHTGTQTAGTITGLATVATTGAYGDLSGRPTLGSAASRDAGASSGNVPILDGSGLIPSALLPGFVDDVLEFSNVAAFPATGETGKLYVSLATNRVYRWSGSIYIEIAPSPGSTDSVTEGSVNLYFTTARGQSAASSWWSGYRSTIGDQLATANSQSAARGFIGAGTSSVAISTAAAQPLGATASAGSTGQAADAGHIHARSTYSELGAIGDGLILVISNKGESATAATNYAEVPVPVPSGSFTLTAVRFGCHIDNTGSSSSTFNAYKRTAAGTKTSVLTGNATLASAASLIDASATITGGTFSAGDRIGVDLVGVGTGAQGLFAQFIFTRSAT